LLAAPTNLPSDYHDAFKFLQQIYKRREVVIRFQRGSAGTEWIPSTTRPTSTSSDVVPDIPRYFDDDLSCFPPLPCDPMQSFDIPEVHIPTSSRFSQVGFTDASFAVGELKMSITGLIIYVNCTPIIWASEKQTSVADSTCSSEFVGASVCAKQLTHVENMCRFLGFVCPKPYPLYTDSQASQIATNSEKMGKIRHIAIRYHLVRQMIASGDIRFVFCFTEEMIADLMTKIMSGEPYNRLALRFYFLGLCGHNARTTA
jgi:hypothetical protein